MLVPISINAQDILDQYSISQKEVEDVIDHTIKNITAAFAAEWESTALSTLKSTKNRYVSNLKVIDSGRMEGAVILDYSQDPLIKMIEEGSSAFDMKCIVNPYTKIYTSSGYKDIKDIKIGDLVLTHTGKFQRVANFFKEKNEDEFIFSIEPKLNSRSKIKLQVTSNHPILTCSGWKRADQLNNNDKLIVSAIKCNQCGKLISTSNIDREKIYCDRSCASKTNNKFRRENGRTDLSIEARKKISEAATKTNNRLYFEGKHVTQTGKLSKWVYENAKNNPNWGFGGFSEDLMRKVQKNAAIGWGKANKNSDPESKIWDRIKYIDGIERQFQFTRDIKYRRSCDSVDRTRKFYFDFAIPKHKICIEINGERWHTEEQDNLKRHEIESKGWKYLSFWSKRVYSDLNGCVDEINRVLDNHNGNYEFNECSFEIKKIYRKKLGTLYNYKYNLTVDNDSSYIANGIVTHNSGFSQSPKKKIKANSNGWYLTIPFSIGTPGASETSGFANIMPKEIHSIIKSKPINPATGRSAGMTKNEIPEQYQIPKVRAAIVIPESASFKEYKNKASVFQGLYKQKDSVTGQSSYGSFRRVSDKSDPNSWIHPGTEAQNLAERAMDNFDGKIQQVLEESVDSALSYFGLE